MPICHNRKILFIHNPKCAGTSISKSLNMFSPKNAPNIEILSGIYNNIVLQTLCLEYYNKYTSEDLSNYTIFTCVRNPYERVLSDYMWCDRGFSNILDFCKFIKQTLQTKKNKYEYMQFDSKYYYNHILPQSEYINNTNLKVQILHMENLNEEFKKLFPNIILKHENKTSHSNYKNVFKNNKECINIINEIYKKDFETFGYEMLS